MKQVAKSNMRQLNGTSGVGGKHTGWNANMETRENTVKIEAKLHTGNKNSGFSMVATECLILRTLMVFPSTFFQFVLTSSLPSSFAKLVASRSMMCCKQQHNILVLKPVYYLMHWFLFSTDVCFCFQCCTHWTPKQLLLVWVLSCLLLII